MNSMSKQLHPLFTNVAVQPPAVADEAKVASQTIDYGAIAVALGHIMSEGVKVAAPDINKSLYTFTPDERTDTIHFGLSGITRVSADLIDRIVKGRPYTSYDDFVQRIRPNKLALVNLIKCGAFEQFEPRHATMDKFLYEAAEVKKVVNLRNMKMLIGRELLPEELRPQIKLYNFNVYLKKSKRGTKYILDEHTYRYFSENYDIDMLDLDENGHYTIDTGLWDKTYKKGIKVVSDYLKKHQAETLAALNNLLVAEQKEKYAGGSISKWEMQSISCYLHEHELAEVYQWDNFFELHEDGEIAYFKQYRGRQIPMYTLHRIAGTVLDRDKDKKTVTILTPQGVVLVHVYGGAFAEYDKQISEPRPDGTKKVVEKSMFSRGNIIIVTGRRRGDSFMAKTYYATPYHKVERIDAINPDGTVEVYNREFAGDKR